MDAIVLLCDAASQEGPPGGNGKISALGLGWSQTVTPTPPGALVVFFRIPWTATNVRHTFRLELLDEDGAPVSVPTESGGQPLFIEGQFEVGRPPGLPHGTELTHSFCATLGAGIELRAGRSYAWRLNIDGAHDESWKASFFVRGSA